MAEISERNNKQDVSIGRLDEKFKALKETLEKFITNDFEHLKIDVKNAIEKIDDFKKWLIGILGSLIVALILLVINLFK